ncbi:hypothetical protein JXD20_00725 [Candidatus Peregrinibacteria bacterium]|nr:hypothetical protein [Candidatus Peregrinibacteria bacterium]
MATACAGQATSAEVPSSSDDPEQRFIDAKIGECREKHRHWTENECTVMVLEEEREREAGENDKPKQTPREVYYDDLADRCYDRRYNEIYDKGRATIQRECRIEAYEQVYSAPPTGTESNQKVEPKKQVEGHPVEVSELPASGL